MNEAQKKQCSELDSLKTETEPTVRDDAVAESSTPGGEAVKKRKASADLENACQRDMVFLRRMLFYMSAAVLVALLTAAAALFLAISAMKGKHNYAYYFTK